MLVVSERHVSRASIARHAREGQYGMGNHAPEAYSLGIKGGHARWAVYQGQICVGINNSCPIYITGY